jgi:hypothetical protein
MSEKKIAILQSNYIPWKGYFDIINSVDEFIIYDEVQYTKNDWRNRNVIKTANGPAWLTIPVRQERTGQLIKDTKIADARWGKKHWSTISQNYSKAKYFKAYKEIFEEIYLNPKSDLISDVNLSFIKAVNNILKIDTLIKSSADFDVVGGQTERLLNICKACDAGVYLSGPAAKEYFDEKLAHDYGIELEWMDYSNYVAYPQLHGEFEHGVSILDLIFNMGENSIGYMKSHNMLYRDKVSV